MIDAEALQAFTQHVKLAFFGVPRAPRRTKAEDAAAEKKMQAFLRTPKGKKWLHRDPDWRASHYRAIQGIPEPDLSPEEWQAL